MGAPKSVGKKVLSTDNGVDSVGNMVGSVGASVVSTGLACVGNRVGAPSATMPDGIAVTPLGSALIPTLIGSVVGLLESEAISTSLSPSAVSLLEAEGSCP